MYRKMMIAAMTAVMLGGAVAGSAHAQPYRMITLHMNGAEKAPVLQVSSTSTWGKLFKRHFYTGERFPYDLRGKYTGDPNMRVIDHRRTIGKAYQCTYMSDLRGRYIICD